MWTLRVRANQERKAYGRDLYVHLCVVTPTKTTCTQISASQRLRGRVVRTSLCRNAYETDLYVHLCIVRQAGVNLRYDSASKTAEEILCRSRAPDLKPVDAAAVRAARRARPAPGSPVRRGR
jgi:hypothetical protein